MTRAKLSVAAERVLRQVPTTKDGYLDMTRVPLESVFKRALSDDNQELGDATRILSSASSSGRDEAAVFLLGLLVAQDPEDLERKRIIVTALAHEHRPVCASLLFAELRRVKSSNTTRRYLSTVIDVLSRFPDELVMADFAELADDKSFTPKMRAKFRRAAFGVLDE